MDAALRKLVRDRAANRCEYCRLHQEGELFFRFHVEHIIPRQHHGGDDASNLALACHHCNLHKGPNLAAIDQVSAQLVQLFHPRRQVWAEHFIVQGLAIRGVTPVGRATTDLLAMNAFPRLQLRLTFGAH